jgi:hypothetical protein
MDNTTKIQITTKTKTKIHTKIKTKSRNAKEIEPLKKQIFDKQNNNKNLFYD